MNRRDQEEKEQEDRPFVLTENRKISTPLMVLLGILSATVTVTLGYAALKSTDIDHEKRIAEVEARTKDVSDMKRDIEWIRRAMEAQDRRAGRAP